MSQSQREIEKDIRASAVNLYLYRRCYKEVQVPVQVRESRIDQHKPRGTKETNHDNGTMYWREVKFGTWKSSDAFGACVERQITWCPFSSEKSHRRNIGVRLY